MATPASDANAPLGDALAEIAALLRAGRADRFRVRAYERGAQVIRALPVAAATLSDAELRRLDAIGTTMAALIREHVRTGRIELLEELRAQEPHGFGTLLGLPLIGLRDARKLAGEHGLRDLRALRQAVAGTAGSGHDADTTAPDPAGTGVLDERLVGRARESLRRLPTALDPRLTLASARRESAALSVRVGELSTVESALTAGAARRGADRVEALSLVVVPAAGVPPATLLEEVAGIRGVVRVVRPGATPAELIAATGHPLLLWVAEETTRGAALLFATGSRGHVAALRRRAAHHGFELRPDGLWDGARRVAGHREDEIYAALGLPTIAPELREDAGALEAADEGALPALVRPGDLRGDLHVHSDWSGDGREPLEEMVRGAAGRGYEYVAITDHAENLTINGMPRDAVRARRRTIAEVQQRHPHVRVLDAAELNIDLQGALDYDLELLGSFELGVASIHSHMDRGATEQTDRIMTAIASPAVHVIGHPTGRIIGRRPGYAIDLAAIAEAAAETGTALEVNGSPSRLDLDGVMVRAALEAGAPLSLSSDAHTLDELSNVAFAVTTARRGWARAADVVNAADLAGLLAFTTRKRRRSTATGMP